MKFAKHHSHLGGLEYLMVHWPELWDEVASIIARTDGDGLHTNVVLGTQERAYDSAELAVGLGEGFIRSDWDVVARTEQEDKRARLEDNPHNGPSSHYTAAPMYFVKNRVAVEVQFGRHFAVAFGLFVKHLAFFVGDLIDVGVEIVPMKQLQEEMSSGVPYYEGELYNLIREGRGVPAVPLVLVGIAP